MSCPWCSPAEDSGSHNICDDCMSKYFGVDPASIHEEIAAEEAAAAANAGQSEREEVTQC